MLSRCNTVLPTVNDTNCERPPNAEMAPPNVTMDILAGTDKDMAVRLTKTTVTLHITKIVSAQT
jgi:hypothetical protein